MKSIRLTEKYLKIIFSNQSLDGLEAIFEPDLQFRGPFFEGNSAKEYIDSLQQSPFGNISYHLLKSYGDSSSACVLFSFSAHGLTDVPMAVFTTIQNDKIASIRLIFDTQVFLSKFDKSRE